MREVNLTQGPILSRLVRFSLPMIAGNMLQQVYNLVDTLVVGRGIGANALAAVGSAYTLMTFLTSILIGLCMGSGAFFSEDYGAGDTAQLRQDMLLSFWFIFGVSLLIYGVIYPGMNPILRLLQTPEELMALMQEYVRAVFAGIFFVFLYNFFAYLLRSMGNSVVPLVFLAVSAVMILLLRDRKNTSEHELQQMEREETAVQGRSDLILKQVAWVLLPFIFLFAIYVLLNGETSPGGGFSGGTILGAGLILFSAAFGPGHTRVLMNQRRYSAVRTFGLLLYAVLYGVYIFIGANGLPNYLTGMILLIDLAVGLVVACTVYGFYALFSRGEI